MSRPSWRTRLEIRSDEIIALPGARLEPRARVGGRRGCDATASGIQGESSVGTMRKVYRGRNIEVSFDLDQCVHIGECLRGDTAVFQLNRRPWVLTDEASADVVAQVVERCPSGALQNRRLDGRPQEQAGREKKATPARERLLPAAGRVVAERDVG